MAAKTSDEAAHQEQLQRLRDEVDALREQLKRAQRLATVGTMTAMVAHEFNNILTPIINYAQLAQRNPSLAAKALVRAADGGQRASHICKAILGLTSGAAETCQKVFLGDLANETLEAMGRDPRRDGIELELLAPADLAIVTRRCEVQQVLLNLLLNARSAVLAKTGRRVIEISAQRDHSFVLLRVRDSGIGISPEDLPRIFQPFFTTKPAGDCDGGSGLGLAICQDLVAGLGGSIWAESVVGQGTTFTVRLPAVAKDRPTAAGAAAPRVRDVADAAAIA